MLKKEFIIEHCFTQILSDETKYNTFWVVCLEQSNSTTLYDHICKLLSMLFHLVLPGLDSTPIQIIVIVDITFLNVYLWIILYPLYLFNHYYPRTVKYLKCRKTKTTEGLHEVLWQAVVTGKRERPRLNTNDYWKSLLRR